MAISAIMQPTFIPWLGYFDLMDKVDVFVYYDDVQLAKRSWQVRNRLKNDQGELWLTIPINKTKSRSDTTIKEAQINYGEPWPKKHLKSLQHAYGKSNFFDSVFALIEENYLAEYSTLGAFNISIIEAIAKKIGIETKRIRSSELSDISGSKDIRLVEINKALDIQNYLSPQGSAEYINESNPGGAFVENGIDLYYHSYAHPEYPQLFGEFIPYLGVFDLLFNVGFENSLDIIRNGRQENIYFSQL